jgi:hypothetical protein
MLARQQAVTKRCNVEVHFIHTETNDSLQVLAVKGGITNLMHGEVILSPAVQFDNLSQLLGDTPTNRWIKFTSSGGAAGAAGTSVGMVTIRLRERDPGSMEQDISVWLLTGVTRVQ